MAEGELNNNSIHNRLPFLTRGRLKFDIATASYTITPFFFFFYLFYYILLYMYTRGKNKHQSLVLTLLWRLTDAMLTYGLAYAVLGDIFLLQRERAPPMP